MADKGGEFRNIFLFDQESGGTKKSGRLDMRIEQNQSRVTLQFSDRVTWVSLDPKDAEQLGQRLIDVARRAQKDKRNRIQMMDTSALN